MTGPFAGHDLSGVVDSHCHFIPPGVTRRRAAEPAHQAALLDAASRLFSSLPELLAASERDGIALRVISAPPALISPEPLAGGEIERINDGFARLVSDNPGRLRALATIDAYAGEAAAREVHRAVSELGLSGIVVDSGTGDLLIDAEAAFPAFEAADALGVPVFIHPVGLPVHTERFSRFGHIGTRFARSISNAAALIALAESERLRGLSRLRTVVATHAVAAFAQIGLSGIGRHLLAGAEPSERRHVYVDTVGLDPHFIRYMAGLLGPDHLLAGSDWPIQTGSLDAARLHAALGAAGLNDHEQRAVARDNALRLLEPVVPPGTALQGIPQSPVETA